MRVLEPTDVPAPRLSRRAPLWNRLAARPADLLDDKSADATVPVHEWVHAKEVSEERRSPAGERPVVAVRHRKGGANARVDPIVRETVALMAPSSTKRNVFTGTSEPSRGLWHRVLKERPVRVLHKRDERVRVGRKRFFLLSLKLAHSTEEPVVRVLVLFERYQLGPKAQKARIDSIA